MGNQEYIEYHNKDNIHLLLDGRNNRGTWKSNVSLELKVRIVDETEEYIKLEKISPLSTDANPICTDFAKGMINKKYVIGVFQKEADKKEEPEPKKIYAKKIAKEGPPS